MKRPVLISLLFFGGVFVLGAVTGGFIGARLVQEVPYRRAYDIFSDEQFKTMADEIGLTPEQRERILPIVKRTFEDVQGLRKQVRATYERMQADVHKEMTPEQQALFTSWRERQRDRERRFQRWAKDERERRPEFADKPQHHGGKPPAP